MFMQEKNNKESDMSKRKDEFIPALPSSLSEIKDLNDILKQITKEDIKEFYAKDFKAERLKSLLEEHEEIEKELCNSHENIVDLLPKKLLNIAKKEDIEKFIKFNKLDMFYTYLIISWKIDTQIDRVFEYKDNSSLRKYSEWGITVNLIKTKLEVQKDFISWDLMEKYNITNKLSSMSEMYKRMNSIFFADIENDNSSYYSVLYDIRKIKNFTREHPYYYIYLTYNEIMNKIDEITSESVFDETKERFKRIYKFAKMKYLERIKSDNKV